VSPDEIAAKVRAMLDDHLNLERGEMMMPLKAHEIELFGWAICDLVEKAVAEVGR
jgi:hypothetical protein